MTVPSPHTGEAQKGKQPLAREGRGQEQTGRGLCGPERPPGPGPTPEPWAQRLVGPTLTAYAKRCSEAFACPASFGLTRYWEAHALIKPAITDTETDQRSRVTSRSHTAG